MTNVVDARGLDCPQPVLATKKALESIEQGVVRVIVDNPVSRDNVKRFAESRGCQTMVEEKLEEFHLEIVKGDSAKTEQKRENPNGEEVVVICTDVLGTGERELGEILMMAFIKTLMEVEPIPAKLIFMNAGVRLTTEGSEVLNPLKALEEKGVRIFSCGTCLDYYNLKDKLKIGVATNMYDTVQYLMAAGKVIGL